MRYSKWFVWIALAAGMALPGAKTLSAQPPEWRDRDLSRDYNRVDRMRADIARDQWRLNEAVRCGRNREAARIARDLARDQRALDNQLRDVRHDQYRDRYDQYRERYDNRWR